ncbi:sigma-70 family RNA polymerase sigma factor family protein [Jatrophihabitans fulvus]
MTTDTENLTTLEEHDFVARVERHRRELHVHCYRLLGSFDDAEDLVQESFLRAWRRRDTYAGRASVRAWLYRIATNACLDALDKRPRRPTADGEILWLQPYPDELLAQLPDHREGPEDIALTRETVELAFVTAIQHLAPLPRAVVVLRDVLGCSAKDTADLLETTVASVNSALQRARAGMRDALPDDRTEWRAEPSAAERDLLARYVDCTERVDLDGLAALVHEDVRFSMPPIPGTWEGKDAVVRCWDEGGFGSEAFGSVRTLPTRANGHPAFGVYVRVPGDEEYRALTLEAVRFRDGAVADIVNFDRGLFTRFGLPMTLGAGQPGVAVP